MFIIYNLRAFIGVAGAILLGMLAYTAFHNEHVTVFAAGLGALLADGFLRMRSDATNSVGGRLLFPKTGGHIFFIPLWIGGILLMIISFTPQPG